MNSFVSSWRKERLLSFDARVQDEFPEMFKEPSKEEQNRYADFAELAREEFTKILKEIDERIAIKDSKLA